jgi:hypothetical protein
VFGERTVRDELKLPVPVPSDVLVESEMVGEELVDHTTPLAVMGAHPSDVMFPPVVAVVVVMELADRVLIVGRTTGVIVVKVISFPYPVPALLIA